MANKNGKNVAFSSCKTFLRNKMNDDRLSNLAIISIEKEIMKYLKNTGSYYDSVIKIFVKDSNRRADFLFK